MLLYGYFYLTGIQISIMELLAGTMSVALGDQYIFLNPQYMLGTYKRLLGFLWIHMLYMDFSL